MTATLLSVDDVRQHLQTALPDAALQRFLDRGEADINDHCGHMTFGSGDIPEEIVHHDYGHWYRQSILQLNQTPSEIISVVDVDTLGNETDLLEGVAEDWVLDGFTLRRQGAYWGYHTVVTYVPDSTLAQRKGLLLQLVELQINIQPGQGFAGAATWQETFKDYETEKQHLLWAACAPPVFA